MRKKKIKFYTVKETAEILRFTPLTIYRWLKKGKIHGIKLGGRQYRINKDEIDQFL